MTYRAVSCSFAALLAALISLPSACSDHDSVPSSGAKAGSAGASAESGAGASSSGAPSGGSPAASGGGSQEGGDSAQAGSASGGEGLGAGGEGSDGSAACHALVQERALAVGEHIVACTPITYATNPPSSGQHYPTWADFGAYDFALPRGYWVHNLEHGAVVVTYHCEDGCAADLAAAKAWLAELKPDATCSTGPARALLVPDPDLDVPWAASAWGFTLRADCFDPQAFTKFYLEHAGQAPAPEASLCGSGFDFRAEGSETCGAK